MKKLNVFLLGITGLMGLYSCSHSADKINEQLYSSAMDSGLLPFKNGDTLTAKGTSPHGNFVLKVNAEMASVLDGNGKIVSGKEIPEGALIVKEIIDNNGLNLIALMKKERKSKFAKDGWIWAEYKPGGAIYYDAKKKGASCVGCHSGAGNQDFTLTFGLH
jgi:hypothetical protein